MRLVASKLDREPARGPITSSEWFPFGRTFTFADPDGYQVTLHDRA